MVSGWNNEHWKLDGQHSGGGLSLKRGSGYLERLVSIGDFRTSDAGYEDGSRSMVQRQSRWKAYLLALISILKDSGIWQGLQSQFSGSQRYILVAYAKADGEGIKLCPIQRQGLAAFLMLIRNLLTTLRQNLGQPAFLKKFLAHERSDSSQGDLVGSLSHIFDHRMVTSPGGRLLSNCQGGRWIRGLPAVRP